MRLSDIPITGFSATNCSACSSSLGSIALGVSLLRSGQLDLLVAGGYDTISEYVYAGFNSLRLVAALSALRPFTKDRQGMKLAEGYGIVILERADDAARAAISPLATILGYGESADAHHLTQPHPQGEGAARAISAALTSAGLTPAQIDLIAAHATGTPDNDAGEYAALSRVFGAGLARVPVVAFKSHLGHTLGGGGRSGIDSRRPLHARSDRARLRERASRRDRILRLECRHRSDPPDTNSRNPQYLARVWRGEYVLGTGAGGSRGSAECRVQSAE